YRIVFGESDGIPSFILDRYAEAYSYQILSAGLEAEREELFQGLRRIFQPRTLVERNDVLVRNLERLPLASQVMEGGTPIVDITEGGLHFRVNLLEGQKTGAFLDQRDNRLKAAEFAQGKKRILDVFSYQGWFACHLARGGAEEVIAVEQSPAACLNLEANLRLNDIKVVKVEEANAFDFLKEADQRKERFDLINLDPPAFVKSRSHLKPALKGYKEINLRGLRLLNPGGILITSSCSHHLSEEQFLETLN